MSASSDTGPDRSILPLPEPEHSAITEVDARKATAPPRFELKPPKGSGAPNVVFVLIDDIRLSPIRRASAAAVDVRAFERVRAGRAALHQPAYRAGLFADPGGVADRPQLA